ncbi:MAG: DNA-deoxyinosine glycosylase [Clostridia bacterium]|nr:DNA-deoxyinosine glycosylase [Clostridia bacterium]
MVEHPIAPVYDNNSKVLILGSFPSVKSREEMFFYGHPQNRFWKVLAGVFAERVPKSIQEKRSFLLDHKIALWDVIASCDIEGSSDSSIKNVVPNNLNTILEQSNIEEIFVNGKTAYKYYNTYLRDTLKREAICLPSTSPANAAWNLEKLICAWSAVKK